MGKPVLYTGAASARALMSSSRLRAVAREFMAIVRLSVAQALLPGEDMPAAAMQQVAYRMDRLLLVRHLAQRGMPVREAIELSGVPRNTWYRWNAAYRRSRGNPRSLADASSAPKTKRVRTAWTPLAEWYVLQRRG